MKINLTIEQADNGMVVRSDEYVSVIENTHSAEEGRKDHLSMNSDVYSSSMSISS